eukprot:8193805-Prorocentrum_lima.AAC.1
MTHGGHMAAPIAADPLPLLEHGRHSSRNRAPLAPITAHAALEKGHTEPRNGRKRPVSSGAHW